MNDEDLCDEISRELTHAMNASGMADVMALQDATSWVVAIEELIGMIQAADETTTPEVYDWVMGVLRRIGQHLDHLPAGYRIPPIPVDDLLRARAGVLSA